MSFSGDSFTRTCVIGAAIALSGCMAGGVNPPVVADYNGASVKIVIPMQLAQAQVDQANDLAQAEATRICQAGNHKRAEFASVTALNYSTSQRLYLCLD